MNHLPLALMWPAAWAGQGRLETAPDQLPSLEAACQEFEALLVGLLLRPMTREMAGAGKGGRAADDIIASLWQQAVAEQISRRGLGIAEMLISALKPHLVTADTNTGECAGSRGRQR